MQIPKAKQIPSYVPEFVRTGLGLSLALLYDGRVYDDFPGYCQHCGSKNCIKMGFEDDGDGDGDGCLFAKLMTPKGGFVDVKVFLQRYYCKDCRRTYNSNGPFYHGASYGAPIVDLALMLSMDNSSRGAERVLTNLGIQVNSDTILNYIRLFAERSREFAPLAKGSSLYGINLLKVLFGVNNARELGEKLKVEDLQSLADEAYLRKKGALKKFIEEITDARDRHVVPRMNGKNVVIKDGKASFPESFTLALSYIPGAEAYASLICTPQPFNQILAGLLFKVLEGSPFTVTDRSRNYDEVKNRVGCALHKTRSELKRDSKFRELKKGVREALKKEKEAKSEQEEKQAHEERISKQEEIREYAKGKYQDVVKETLEEMKQTHPDYFDKNGNFNGQITTNGMEGGNFRMKYNVRLPYGRDDSVAGKSILSAIKDSVFTLRGGRVKESLANKLGFFSFGRIMTPMTAAT